MRASKLAFRTSVGLFVFSLLLPAVNLDPWEDGWRVFIMSFTGLFVSLPVGSSKHFAACLLGASANALMLFAYIRIWKRRCKGAPLSATAAVMFTLLAYVPLASIARATSVVSFGYYFWVSAAFTLALSAWLHAGETGKTTELPMPSSSRTWVIISCLLALIVVSVLIKHGWKTREEARCATEGQAAVESFLRDGAGGVFTNEYGSFLRLEGSGYHEPVWNIQGYHYLTLQRTGFFSRRSLPIRIYVTEGRVTAPGLKTVGTPTIETLSPIQGATIFVAHPEVKP